MTFTPEQIAREKEWKSIFQACDKAKRILVKAMETKDADERRDGLADYNRRVRAVNPRIRAANGGWIKWRGGECPVNETANVEAQVAEGKYYSGLACSLYWPHTKGAGNIIRYRVVK